MKRKIALFTGAGCSKAFEFPLTGEIFPKIRQRLSKNRLFGGGAKARAMHAQLKRFLQVICPGLGGASDHDLPLITDVLSLLDHSLVSGSTVGLGIQRRQLQEVRRLLERAIYDSLDWEVGFDSEADPPEALRLFVRSIGRLRRGGAHVGIISTNYDPVVEMYLFRDLNYTQIKRSVDFGCDWRDDSTGSICRRPTNPKLSIFKLHGSLNMLRCPNCDHTYINLDGDISYLAYTGNGEARQDGWNQCHCDYSPLETCMIAPSSVRDIRDSNLLEIWRHSLEFLRKADHWIIIGYSFPPEDLAIRSMFCRAYQGRVRKPCVTVVQHGYDPRMVARYRLMFPNCRYEIGGTAAFAEKYDSNSEYVLKLPRADHLLRHPPG